VARRLSLAGACARGPLNASARDLREAARAQATLTENGKRAQRLGADRLEPRAPAPGRRVAAARKRLSA